MLLLPRYQVAKRICGSLSAPSSATRISTSAILSSGLRPPTDPPQSQESAPTVEPKETFAAKSSAAITPKQLQQLARPLKDELNYLINRMPFVRKFFLAEKRSREEYSKRLLGFVKKASYMDEMQTAYNNVKLIKEELQRAADEKRKIMRDLQNVRNELTHIYEMKCSCVRSSKKFLQLMDDELELCKKDQHLQEAYTEADDKGQSLIHALERAINASHEAERVHTNFVKIIGVFASILTAVLAAVASIMGYIHNQNKYNSLKQDVEDTISRKVVNKLDELLKMKGMIEKPQESWGSYLKRHTRWLYGWAMPKN